MAGTTPRDPGRDAGSGPAPGSGPGPASGRDPSSDRDPGFDRDPSSALGLDLEVRCHLDRLLAERDLTLSALAERVGITVVNLSVLKNDRAKAIRFTTLVALCRELDCTPGDLFSVAPHSDG